jgi:hypothetical protein
VYRHNKPNEPTKEVPLQEILILFFGRKTNGKIYKKEKKGKRVGSVERGNQGQTLIPSLINLTFPLLREISFIDDSFSKMENFCTLACKVPSYLQNHLIFYESGSIWYHT